MGGRSKRKDQRRAKTRARRKGRKALKPDLFRSNPTCGVVQVKASKKILQFVQIHANLQVPVIFLRLRSCFPLVTDAFNLFFTNADCPLCSQP